MYEIVFTFIIRNNVSWFVRYDLLFIAQFFSFLDTSVCLYQQSNFGLIWNSERTTCQCFSFTLFKINHFSAQLRRLKDYHVSWVPLCSEFQSLVNANDYMKWQNWPIYIPLSNLGRLHVSVAMMSHLMCWPVLMKGIHNVRIAQRYCNSLLNCALCSSKWPDGTLKAILSHTCYPLCFEGAFAALEASYTIHAL